jgi:hypothetical protein
LLHSSLMFELMQSPPHPPRTTVSSVNPGAAAPSISIARVRCDYYESIYLTRPVLFSPIASQDSDVNFSRNGLDTT